MKDNTKYCLIKAFGKITLYILVFVPLMSAALIAMSSKKGFSNPTIAMLIVFGVLFVISLAVQPVLLQKRRKYRDLAEYDENGLSKKHSFDRLSKKEREEIERAKSLKSESVLSTTLLEKQLYRGTKKKKDIDMHKSLDGIIGLDNIKQFIYDLDMRLEYISSLPKTERNEFLSKNQLESCHMLFAGNAGTGKTTIARIVASLLYKYGIISENKCLEVNGTFFIGSTLGESVLRTQKILQYAENGVLFIDEAYSLANAQSGSEVIAEIVKTMEDKRDRIAIIFAGYEREMKTLISLNSGLDSRIGYQFGFKDYNIGELHDIFRIMAGNRGYCISESALEAFDKKIYKLQSASGYGNARTVRTITEQAVLKHITNIVKKYHSDDEKYILTEIDIE